MPTQNNAQILRTFYEAVNSRDIDRAVSCFQSNGEFKFIGFETSFQGSGKIKEMVLGWLRAFPDLKLELLNVMGSEAWAVSELYLNGTQKGALSTPQGEIAPSNQRVHVPSCDLVKLQNGKIASFHCYLETGVLMNQLGMKPMMAAA